MHGKHRRSQTRRVPRSRLTRKQGPPAVSPERDLTRAWKIRNRGLAVSQKRALGEPGRHEGKGLAWPGIPAGTTRPIRFFGETLDLEVAFDAENSVELTAGNGDRIQLFGPGTATSSSTATTAPAPSRCSRWTTWIRRGRAGPRRRRAIRRAGVRRHLDQAHLPGARREHPQPGRPHGVAGRQEDSGRTRSTCGRSVHSRREQAVHSYAVWPTA